MGKLLSLTNDYVFKRNFGYKGEEDITKIFLRDILKNNVEIVELNNNPITQKDFLDDKMGIMDVKATINKSIVCDIEIQVASQADIIKRLLFYCGKMYTEELKVGDCYEKAKKTVCILIADFEITELGGVEKYITKWNLREEDYPKKILTEAMEFYIIELPKVEKYGNSNQYKNLNLWVKFIKKPEVIYMIKDENNDEELKETIEAINKVKNNLEKMSEDEHEKELARLRDKYIRDQKSLLATGYADGLEDGKIEGKEEGKKEEQIAIAKKMLLKGIDIESIMEFTELTKEEIESLKL